MFPGFNHSGVIPPFVTDPTQLGGSPYRTDLTSIVTQLGTTPQRRALIAGLLDYREALRAIGITSGFQLIDGSFTENCEVIKARAPSDIDLVTYAYMPVPPADVMAFAQANLPLFDRAQVKGAFKCDSFFVDMAKQAELVVDDTFYWYGLFSHQRVTSTWKGMLRVPLIADDVSARNALVALPGVANGP